MSTKVSTDPEAVTDRLYRAVSDAFSASDDLWRAFQLAPNLAGDRVEPLVEIADRGRELADGLREELNFLRGRLAGLTDKGSNGGVGSVGVVDGVAAHPETVGAPAESRSVDDVVRDQIRQLSEVRRALKAALR